MTGSLPGTNLYRCMPRPLRQSDTLNCKNVALSGENGQYIAMGAFLAKTLSRCHAHKAWHSRPASRLSMTTPIPVWCCGCSIASSRCHTFPNLPGPLTRKCITSATSQTASEQKLAVGKQAGSDPFLNKMPAAKACALPITKVLDLGPRHDLLPLQQTAEAATHSSAHGYFLTVLPHHKLAARPIA